MPGADDQELSKAKQQAAQKEIGGDFGNSEKLERLKDKPVSSAVPLETVETKRCRADFGHIKKTLDQNKITHAEALEKWQKLETKKNLRRFQKIEKEQARLYEEQVGLETDPKFIAEVNEITQRLTQAAGFKEEIKLLPILDDEVNAYVYTLENKTEDRNENGPGLYHPDKQKGHYVFLYTGLIKSFAEYQSKLGRTLSKDNLAFVVAHEMRHLLQQRKERANAVTKRQQEYDADLGGMEIMGRAGFNPREAVEAMEFLRSLSEGQIAYSETHPASASRLVEISKRIADPDVPMRGIGVQPSSFEHLPTTELKSKQLIAEMRQANDLADLIRRFAERTQTTAEAVMAAPLAAEAVRYSILTKLAELPQLQSLTLKYLYSQGKNLVEETQKERAEFQDAHRRMLELEELQKQRKLSDAEFAELREKRKETKGKADKLANYEGRSFDRAKDSFVGPEVDKWGEAWKNIPSAALPFDREVPVVQEFSQQIGKAAYISGVSMMRNMKIVEAPGNVDWSRVVADWQRTGTSNSPAMDVVRLGLKIRQASDSRTHDLQTEQGRQDYLRDFTVFIVDSYLQESGHTNTPADEIQKWISEAVKQQTEPLTEKVKNLITAYLPEGLEEKTKEQVINYFLANIIPCSGKEVPYFSSYGSRTDPQYAETILRLLPQLAYTANKALDRHLGSLSKHGYYSPSYRYFTNLAYSGGRTLDPELVETAIEGLCCRFPEDSNSIESLSRLSRSSPPEALEQLFPFYESKVTGGAADADLLEVRREICGKITDRQKRGMFLLRAYSLRDFAGDTRPSEAKIDLQPGEVEAFAQRMLADGLSVFSVGEVMSYAYTYWIPGSDLSSKIYIESLLQRIGSDALHNQGLLYDLPKFCETAELNIPESLEQLLSMGVVVPKEHLGELARSGAVSLPELKIYYELCAVRLKDAAGKKTSLYGKLPSKAYLESLINIILEQATKEIDQTKFQEFMSQPVGSSMWGYEQKRYSWELVEKDLPFDQIVNLFPACDLRNKLLCAWWKRQGFAPAEFERIFPLCSEDDDDWLGGRNALSLPELIHMGAGEDEEITESGRQRYELQKTAGNIEDYSHFFIFGDSGTLGILEAKYQQDPEFFVSPQRSLKENLAVITKLSPSNDFRDYLINRAIKIELCQIAGQSPDTQLVGLEQYIEDPELRNMLSQDVSVTFVDKLVFPSKEVLDRLGGLGVLERIRSVLPYINSDASRVALGRLALEYGNPQSKEEELGLIREFFAKPSFARDYLLKEYMLKHSLTLDGIRGLKTLLTSDIVREGEVGAGEFLGMEFFRSEVYRLKPERRAEYLLWLLGIRKDLPREMVVSAGLFNFGFDSVKTNFNQLTPVEKRELLGDFLLYKEGLFQPDTPEGEQIMRDFVETLFDNRLATGTEHDNLLKKILVTVFEQSLPERRHALFTSLFFSLEQNQGKKMEFEDLLPLLLENAGIFGTKVSQILSERDTAPFSKGGEKMSPSLKRKLGRAKEKAEPFNTIGVVYNLEDNKRDTEVQSIDGLLSTASLKQAHKSTTRDGLQIEKVKKPNVEKYIDHDIEVLKAVCDLLRQEGYRVPKYFVEYITAIVKDEANFMNEARNQQLLSGNLSKERNGYKLGVPTINFASRDLMEESIAPGVSLDTIKESDPALYRRHSRLTGLELLTGLFEKGVFHADLHDGNEFVDEASHTKTYIDAGAVGDVREDLQSVRKLFKGILLRNPQALAESIINLSETEAASRETDINSLSERLSHILQENMPLGDKVSQVSFEIIDTAIPKRSLRYVLKALVTGAHHIEQVSSALGGTTKPKLVDRLKMVKDLGSIGMHILAA